MVIFEKLISVLANPCGAMKLHFSCPKNYKKHKYISFKRIPPRTTCENPGNSAKFGRETQIFRQK